MRIAALLTTATLTLAAASPALADHHGGDAEHNHVAVCVLLPTIGNNVTGIIKFAEEDGKIHITGTVRGLTPGKHGFHVHEYGDISGLKDGKSTGGHFSPGGHQHGKPSDDASERHIGDLGNIEAGEDGVAQIDMMDEVIEIHGEDSIVGRGIVVHADEDKFTQPTGDAGGRVAIGVIGIAKTPEPTGEAKGAMKEMQDAAKAEMKDAKESMKNAAAEVKEETKAAAEAAEKDVKEEAAEAKAGAKKAADKTEAAAKDAAADAEAGAKKAAANVEQAAEDAAEATKDAVNEAAEEVEAATE